MPDDLEMTIDYTDQGPVINLKGTVDRAAKEKMESGYEDATKVPGKVLFDFSEVNYINSTGIAVIVGILAMARAEGRKVGAFGLSDHYREVFQITRLADFMTIYEDAAAAKTAG
ncbi:MAG: STAS domain-containing protein [Actinomycetota bacterium]